MNRILDRCSAVSLRPTAVIASNDLTAIGAIGAMRERGLRVPEDISVVGFDDIELSGHTQPALTTVHLPRVQIAEMAFHALYQGYTDPGGAARKGSSHVVQPHLVIRRSTGRPAGHG